MPELRNLDVQFVSLVDRAAVRDPSNPTEPQRLLLWKAERGANTDPQGGNVPTPEELSAALKKAETDRDELAAKVEKLEKKLAKKNKTDEPAPLNKADLSPEARAYVEKMEAERAAEKARVEKAESDAQAAAELAKAERDTRITREYVTKAERDYQMLPVNPTEFGPVLKSMAEKLSEAERGVVETLLKAADEHLRQNSQILKELGRSGDPTPGSDDAAEHLRKAEELRKANPGMSMFESMKQAMGSREQQVAYLASQR